ncbi:MAG: DUF2238 domain-containing protein [Kiritimatiellae bacterium]|nr:DUF2238 domain-containing protein [Kiritimatiellia bacterium]
MKRIETWLAATLAAIVAWSACDPADWTVWWMEMVWVLGVFALLAATYKRMRFSAAAYAIVSIWLAMHTIGAHYTFENVPFKVFAVDGDRNCYDRVAHFCIGLNAYLFAELFLRTGWARHRIAAAVSGTLAIMAMAGAWEIIEWIGAELDGGTAGLAFVGAQGDVWDAQKDILCDTLGAILSSCVFVSVTAKCNKNNS